jgi:hypothetical protein
MDLSKVGGLKNEVETLSYIYKQMAITAWFKIH